MVNIPTDVTRSLYRTIPAQATVEFREQGSRQIHHGRSLERSDGGLRFETDYAVAPGVQLRVRLRPHEGDGAAMEARMQVVRVDSLPGQWFQVTARLLEHD